MVSGTAEGSSLEQRTSGSVVERAEALFAQWVEAREVHGHLIDAASLTDEAGVRALLEDLVADYEAIDLTLPTVGHIGRTLGHYRIERLIGRGGMSEVYLATDTRLDRPVALKTLPQAWTQDPERVYRLRQEAKALAAIDHPHTVTLYSVEEEEGVLFLTMAYVDGHSLDEVIPSNGLPVGRFFDLTTQLIDALSAAHMRDIIHRDLKPSNIMVDQHGRLRVLDFGLAKRVSGIVAPEKKTASGVIFGTFPFMSPEQVQGRVANAQSDIFSLGVVLYRMATGKMPFEGGNSAAVVSSILRDTPPAIRDTRPDYPPAVDDIVARCLQKNRADRYATIDDVRQDLRAAAPSVIPRTQPRRRMWPWVLAAGLVAVGAVLAAEPVREAVRTRRLATPTAPVNRPLIAVLPFEVLGDQRGAALAQGLHAALLTELARSHDVRLASRASVARYSGQQDAAQQATADLGADLVLESGLQFSAQRIRVTSHLIDAHEEWVIWGDVFDRNLNDANTLDVQTNLATALARSLQAELRPRPKAGLGNLSTHNRAAYHAYIRGLELRFSTSDTPDAAVDSFRKATQLDGEFVEAWAELSASLAYQFFRRRSRELTYDDDLRRAAMDALDNARSRQPGSVAAQFAWSCYLYWVLDEPERALEILDRLEGRAPQDVGIVAQKAFVLRQLGRMDDAHRLMARAHELMPRSDLFSAMLVGLAVSIGDCELARVYAQSAMTLNPKSVDVVVEVANFELSCGERLDRVDDLTQDFDLTQNSLWRLAFKAALYRRDYGLALRTARDMEGRLSGLERFINKKQEIIALRGLGRVQEAQAALATMEKWMTDDPSVADPTLRAIYHSLAGDRELTIRWAKAAELARPSSSDSATRMLNRQMDARLYTRVGAYDEALDALFEAYGNGRHAAFWTVERDPEFDPLRTHPRYAELRQRYPKAPFDQPKVP